jgi:hypothetical protein
LEVSKRLGEKSKPIEKKKENKDKIALQLEAKLEEITVKFFEAFPENEEDYRKEQAAEAKEQPASIEAKQ